MSVMLKSPWHSRFNKLIPVPGVGIYKFVRCCSVKNERTGFGSDQQLTFFKKLIEISMQFSAYVHDIQSYKRRDF